MSDKKLHESSAAKDGANAAAMGEATRGDLDRGFTAVRETHRHEVPMPVRSSMSGFLGRSGGWER